MDKEFWKGFFRFLDRASVAELERKLKETREFSRKTSSRDVRADANRMIRFMEVELLARAGAKSRKTR
jgi:hypothetical protein